MWFHIVIFAVNRRHFGGSDSKINALLWLATIRFARNGIRHFVFAIDQRLDNNNNENGDRLENKTLLCTYFRVEEDWTSVDGGIRDVEGDSVECEELPTLEDAPTIGLFEPPLWFALGDITLALEEAMGDVGDVVRATDCTCWVVAAAVGWEDTTTSVPLSSASSSSELNHISSSSSSWRGSRRKRGVRSKDGTLNSKKYNWLKFVSKV